MGSPSAGQRDPYRCLRCTHHSVLVVNTAEGSVIPSLLSLRVLSLSRVSYCEVSYCLMFQ
jgi:hypothetical protein